MAINGDDQKPLRKISEAFIGLANTVKNNSNSQTPDQEDAVQLETAPFSHACSLVSPLFGCLGIAFKFAEIDYVAKVHDLGEASQSLGTLQLMIDRDVEANCVRKAGSHTRNLLRVKRGLDMVRVLFEQIIATEYSSRKEAPSPTITQPIWPFLSWIQRVGYSFGMWAEKGKEKFLIAKREKRNGGRKTVGCDVRSQSPTLLGIANIYASEVLGQKV
ncbi:hypothetical protein RHMOL_Rhmol02G0199700 [Rhododendron molle]|uniref:Uncharacterized protein n=1 Tax=Rhododendron molle TaxID=49168 RepID=A0ACC0PRT3_RHOML|nr:hypothetical protein RHMOL_Rhmol02G0199700 [Rhododendron molle]